MIHSLYKLVFIIPVLAIVAFLGMYTAHNAHAFSTVELEGYAWSPNTGWISMNCSNDSSCGVSDYKVQINPNKTLSGFSWSANVGWIQFGGLAGFPASGSNAAVSGTYDTSWGFTGWARALGYADGWDGWISLSGIASDASSYTLGFSDNGSLLSSSYGWGADVIGWISFSSSFFTPPNIAGNTCTADYLGTIYTDMWGDEQPAAATVCIDPEVCTNSNPVCAEVVITGTLTVVPALVRESATADISWVIDVPGDVDTCNVTSNDGGNWASSPSESSPLTFNTNIFTLYCIPAGGGPEIEVDTMEVRKIPNVIEI